MSRTNVEIWLRSGCAGLFDPEGKRVITHQHVQPSATALAKLDKLIQFAPPEYSEYVRDIEEYTGAVTGFRIFYVDESSIGVATEQKNWVPWVLPATKALDVNALHYHVEFGKLLITERSSGKNKVTWKRNNIAIPGEIIATLRSYK